MAKQVTSRRTKYFEHQKKNIKKLLILALKEFPPPSLSLIGRRLDYTDGGFLRKCFPTLSLEISKRFLEHKPKRLIVLSALQLALTEDPPPSINSVAKSIEIARSRLYATDSKLCHLISERHLKLTKDKLNKKIRTSK